MILIPNRRKHFRGGGNIFTANYNDFTFVDPDSKITAQDATSVATGVCLESTVLYGYYDLGAADFISGPSIIAEWEQVHTGGAVFGGRQWGLVLSNTVGDALTVLAASDAAGGGMKRDTTNNPRVLSNLVCGTAPQDNNTDGLLNTKYYYRSFIDTDADTIQTIVYTDAARTSILVTGALKAFIVGQTGWRYVYTLLNGDGAGTGEIATTCSNLVITW